MIPTDPDVRIVRLKPRLKEAREARGLSQTALGQTLARQSLPGFRATHVGLFELGYRDATWPEVAALAAALAVDATWLAGTEATRAPVAPPADAPALTPPTPSIPPAVGAARASSLNGLSATVPAAAPPARLPPDQAVRGQDTVLVYRTRLADQLTAANRTLQDRTLTPVEWRAWRTFSEALRTTLRGLS